ncbi:MAG: S-layer homology domain-containing protein [Chloroflexota bacterium]|nr:S-layer homology domain-containing protein [Chloroflexota bacterium]MDQ5866647.1 S-layer homology domain-containing protein [Chloroflexota bacterium]
MKAFVSSLIVAIVVGVAALFLFAPTHATPVGAAGSASPAHQNAGKGDAPQGAATAEPTCPPSWVVVPSPNVISSGQQSGYSINQLMGVSVVSEDDVWAVGYYNDPNASKPDSPSKHVAKRSPHDTVQTPEGYPGTLRTLIEHYDGTAWTIVPSPNKGSDANMLNSVVALASDDVWAAGSYINEFGIAQTLVQHWDGEVWSLVDSPNVGPLLDNRLTAIDASAPDDVWAVGYYYTEKAVAQTLTMHWDGTEWSIVASPNVVERNNFLYSLTVVGPNDAWAVGAYGTTSDYQYLFKSLALHWNGAAWTVVDTPSVGSFTNILYGVDAASSDDVWAVGMYSGTGATRALMMHWDGTEWTAMPGPSDGSSNDTLYGVKTLGPNDAWAVGHSGGSNTKPQTLTMHWDGTEWSKVRGPNPGQDELGYISFTVLHSVDASGSEDVWSVGHFERGSYYNRRTLTEHYTTDCVSCPTSFTDVQPGSPFYPYVQCLSCQGIVSGYACEDPANPCYGTPGPSGTPSPSGTPDTSVYYRPASPVTRGQLAKIIANAASFDDDPGNQMFEDVYSGDPFYYWINQLARKGIIAGYPCGTVPSERCGYYNLPYFRPNAYATRGQIAKIVSEAREYSDDVPANQQSFVDVPPGSPFWLYVERLRLNGSVISGYACGGPGEPCPGAYFRPQANASRGQVAKIVSRAFLSNCYLP